MKLRLSAIVCFVSSTISVAVLLYLRFVEPRFAATRPPGQGPGLFTVFCYMLTAPGMFLMTVVLPREYTTFPALADPPLFIYGVVIALNVVFWTSAVWLG